MSLPYILVFDDLWFWSKDERAKACARLGLFDADENSDPQDAAAGCVAIAEFKSGQMRRGDEIVNDSDLAMRQIETRWRRDVDHRWALVLLDLQFDKGAVNEGEISPITNWPRDAEPDFGLKVLQKMIERWPDQEWAGGISEIPVVIMSRSDEKGKASAASRAGALRYVEKRNLDRQLLQELLDQMGLIEDKDDGNRILGHSPALLKTLKRAREAGHTSKGNVLILGKRGSGKTMLADYIHRHSPRRSMPMQKLTVSEGMDATLLKAQLYGFWHGAYTPADRSEAGLAERAHRSTLFLDEIGNLPPSAQSELLEFGRLQADGMRSLSRLGTFPTSPQVATRQAHQSVIGTLDRGTQRIAVDVFLIAATNKPLEDPEYVRKTGFLGDLLDRLRGEYFPHIIFPTMKDRGEDIVPLFQEFLRKASEATGGAWPKSLDPEVTQRLEAYSWPGNVAEIQGIAREVERASRHFHNVHGRHLGNFDGPGARSMFLSLGETPSGLLEAPVTGDTKTQPPRGDTTLKEIIDALRKARFEGLRSELEGALPLFQVAYGEALVKLLAVALDYTRELPKQRSEVENGNIPSSAIPRAKKRDVLGDLNPTRAMKLLLRRSKLSTSEAQDEIKRMFARLEKLPDADSSVGRVLAWARTGRKGTK